MMTPPWKEFPEMMLDLSDDPPRPVPGGGLILDAPIADQRGVAGPAAGSDEEVLDGPLQHGIGRETDGRRPMPSLQRLGEGREGTGRVGADDDGLPPGLGPLNDREDGLLPPVRTVDVAWPERGGQAVAVLVEDEEGMGADGLDGAGVGRLLVRAVDRALGELSISTIRRRVSGRAASCCTRAVLRCANPWSFRSSVRTSVSTQCRVDVSAILVSLNSREIGIRTVGSAASRSASWVFSYPARRL